MRIVKTKFQGLKIIEGLSHYDKRGCFRETFKNKFFPKKNFIFWCMSKSRKNVIRGLHMQKKIQQDKFISVVKGRIFDVVLDLRKKSRTYGRHFSITLSDKNSTSLFISKNTGIVLTKNTITSEKIGSDSIIIDIDSKKDSLNIEK